MFHITLKEAASHDDYCNIYCGNHLCDHSGTLEYRPLLERYGEGVSFDVVLARLTCKKCGHRGATARLASYDPKRPAKPLFDPVTGKRLGE